MTALQSTSDIETGRHSSGHVYRQLRDMIIALELPPGAVLQRAELMARFGISQTPIRDALLKLAEEDLVEIYPQHITRVSLIDPPKALETHFLRRALELEVADRLASNPQAPVVEQARQILHRQRLALDAGDLSDFNASDSLFHKVLYDAANVSSLWPLIRGCSGHIDRLRRLHLPDAGKAASVLADHREILSAIERGRPQLAREAMSQHLSGTLSKLDEIRNRFPEYMR